MYQVCSISNEKMSGGIKYESIKMLLHGEVHIHIVYKMTNWQLPLSLGLSAAVYVVEPV